MRSFLTFCGCLWLLASLGCTMCANPHDCKYAAFGGVRQRSDRVHGRLGSDIDPAPESAIVMAKTEPILVPVPADDQPWPEVAPDAGGMSFPADDDVPEPAASGPDSAAEEISPLDGVLPAFSEDAPDLLPELGP